MATPEVRVTLSDNWDAVAAGLAAYVKEFLPHCRRGAIPVRLPAGAGQVVGAFGNDGYSADDKVRAEVAVLRQRLREGGRTELGFGLSEDGHAWALLVCADALPCRASEDGGATAKALAAWLDDAVWDAWGVACGLPLSEDSTWAGEPVPCPGERRRGP
jgi:hypothetical protein